MKRLLPILLLVFSVGVEGAFEQDVTKLKATNECRSCQLIGANLKGLNLEGADLKGAGLAHANLEEGNLAGADLTWADLEDANLNGVNLFRATLKGAKLKWTNLTNANLEAAILIKANLTRANLSGADLTDANLSGAKLKGADLEEARFCNTTMPDNTINNSGCESEVASSSSNSMVWCASHTGVFRMRNRICTDSEGRGYTKKVAAEAQYRRLKSGSSPSTSYASSSSNSMVWCASHTGVFRMRNRICTDSEGRGYTKEAAAEAQYRRLKSGSSSSTSYASSSSNSMVWCASHTGVFRMRNRICTDSEGRGYTKKAAAEAQYRRLKSGSSSSTSYASSSSNSMVWCASHTGVFRMRNRICTDSEGRGYTKKAAAEAQYRRLKSGSSSSTSYASLTLRSNVRGDRVYIDGKYKGSTRLDLDLPKGRYTIRIEKEGYKTYEERIDLENALTLRASLEKTAKNSIQTLLETNKCPGCDLTGADLTGANLTGADLTGADLTGVNLTGANLQNAKLAGTDLRDANLMNANFHMARFCNTTMPDGSKENSDCSNDEG